MTSRPDSSRAWPRETQQSSPQLDLSLEPEAAGEPVTTSGDLDFTGDSQLGVDQFFDIDQLLDLVGTENEDLVNPELLLDMNASASAVPSPGNETAVPPPPPEETLLDDDAAILAAVLRLAEDGIVDSGDHALLLDLDSLTPVPDTDSGNIPGLSGPLEESSSVGHVPVMEENTRGEERELTWAPESAQVEAAPVLEGNVERAVSGGNARAQRRARPRLPAQRQQKRQNSDPPALPTVTPASSTAKQSSASQSRHQQESSHDLLPTLGHQNPGRPGPTVNPSAVTSANRQAIPYQGSTYSYPGGPLPGPPQAIMPYGGQTYGPGYGQHGLRYQPPHAHRSQPTLYTADGALGTYVAAAPGSVWSTHEPSPGRASQPQYGSPNQAEARTSTAPDFPLQTPAVLGSPATAPFFYPPSVTVHEQAIAYGGPMRRAQPARADADLASSRFADPSAPLPSTAPRASGLDEVGTASYDLLEDQKVASSRAMKKKKDPRCDPSRVYTAVIPRPAAWGPITIEGYPLFTYTRDGQLAEDRAYSTTELRHYLDLSPSVLWVQQAPSQCAGRLTMDDRRCRWNECPVGARIISSGWARIAFDETPVLTSNGTKDPFKVAGVMHLWCFEQCFDMVEFYAAGRLRAENRRLPKETVNCMSLERETDRAAVSEVFEPWFEQRMAEFKAKGPMQMPRPHQESLSHALVKFHLFHQTTARQKARAARNAERAPAERKTIDIHMGDLGLFSKISRQCRNARKDRSRRRMLAQDSGDGDEEGKGGEEAEAEAEAEAEEDDGGLRSTGRKRKATTTEVMGGGQHHKRAAVED